MLYTIRANVIIDGKQLGSSYAKAHHHPTTNNGTIYRRSNKSNPVVKRQCPK